ncbi:MAG: hypothetical protein QXF26_03345 [Candidatus Bathyarchaeia archaeon]
MEVKDGSVSHLFYLDGMELEFNDTFPFSVRNKYLAFSLALPKILNVCAFTQPSRIELPAHFKSMVSETWFEKAIRQVYNYPILIDKKPEYPRLEVSPGEKIRKTWSRSGMEDSKVLSLLSFGKDSLLNTLIAKAIGYEVTFLTLKDELFGEDSCEQVESIIFKRRVEAANYVRDRYGLEGYFVSTKLHYVPMCKFYSTNMFVLNVLNGYFCALLFSEKYGQSIISAGNEYGCNLDVKRKFYATLHCSFDKTVWFTRLFRRFLSSLHPNLRLYSFVEPFVDWETQALLARVYPDLIPYQTSCESVLCSNCDKCLVMWLVSKIFGFRDMLKGLRDMSKEQVKDILEESTLGIHAGVAWCLRRLNIIDDEKTNELADLYNFGTVDERVRKSYLPQKAKRRIVEMLRAADVEPLVQA